MWFFIAVAAFLVACFVGYFFVRAVWRWRSREAQVVRFDPIDPNDSDDPMYDPAVQAMMREVIRTGRPMHMVRGQAPTFVDEEKPEIGPDDSVP